MRTVLLLASAATLYAGQSAAPPSNGGLTKTLNELAKECRNPARYSWSGTVLVDRREGEGPFTRVADARVQIATAENGKSMFKLRDEEGTEYWLISDGKKSWSYLPSKKQYMEEEAANSSENEEGEGGDSEQGTIAERSSRQAIAELDRFIQHAQSVVHAKDVPAKFGGEKVHWATIDIVEKPDEKGNKGMAEVVMAPDRPVLARLIEVQVRGAGSEARTSRVTIDFDSFSVGQPEPDGQFTFDPPKKAKLVDDLMIPGQPGSVLLNHPSPDFEARTLTGEKVKLSDLRGKVVLLDFWASWCPPCRAELPTIAKLSAEFKTKGLAVYGVDDEERGTARKYLEKAGLELPTLEDSARKAHHLYRVDAIPTVFVISQDGTVVKWFRGGRTEASLRQALKSAGISE